MAIGVDDQWVNGGQVEINDGTWHESCGSYRIEKQAGKVKLPFEKLIHALCNFPADVMNPDKLLPLAYSFKDHVDPDVNDDSSEDEPTASKQKWFSHLTVSNKGR
ncbi:hypothetical protein Tco_0270613 [Tanacetum coccineum]